MNDIHISRSATGGVTIVGAILNRLQADALADLLSRHDWRNARINPEGTKFTSNH